MGFPETLSSIECSAFTRCIGLTSLTLPHNLADVESCAFADCTGLTSVVFRPPVGRAVFIAWAVSSMRNRDNWQLTTLKQSRNVLRLITALALESRDVGSVDPDGSNGVFYGCTALVF